MENNISIKIQSSEDFIDYLIKEINPNKIDVINEIRNDEANYLNLEETISIVKVIVDVTKLVKDLSEIIIKYFKKNAEKKNQLTIKIKSPYFELVLTSNREYTEEELLKQIKQLVNQI